VGGIRVGRGFLWQRAGLGYDANDLSLKLEGLSSGACGLGGKTGVTADRDKIEFRLFNSSSIFNITLREELFSLPKKNQTCCLVLVSWC